MSDHGYPLPQSVVTGLRGRRGRRGLSMGVSRGAPGHQNNSSTRGSGQSQPPQVRCAVESCRSRMNEFQKLFYSIPTSPETKKVWTNLIQRHNVASEAVLTNYICSDHFSADQKLPNGHLKGNAVPNVFFVHKFVSCIYCGVRFDNRGKLHSHDSSTHLHESRRWKLECEITPVPQGSLCKEDSPTCNDCAYREKIFEQMEGVRSDIQQAIGELKEFGRDHLLAPLKLDLPPPTDEPIDLSDEMSVPTA